MAIEFGQRTVAFARNLSGGLAIAALIASVAASPVLGQCPEGLGDINGNDSIDVTDIQCATLTTLWILLDNGSPPPACLAGTPDELDVNCQGNFDIVDVVTLISLVIGNDLPSAVDANANGCPDACEPPGCGNNIVDEGEECDDGNGTPGDGCSPSCTAETTQIALISPGHIDPAVCTADADCELGGVCIDSICARAWGIESQRATLIEALGVPAGGQQVRVCALGAPGTAPCATAGYGVVATTTLEAQTVEVDLSSIFGEGIFDFTAEVETAPGSGTFASTLSNPVEIFQTRRVFVDLTAPTILSASVLSDELDPSGVLNGLESEDQGDYLFRLESSEPGTAQWTAEGQTKATDAIDVATTAADSLFGFAFDGDKSVVAIAFDRVGNASAPVQIDLVVDRDSPTVEIVSPAKSPIISGDSLDVVVATAPGAEVQLTNGPAVLGVQTADSDGFATFEDALSDGVFSLTAEATSAAGNSASAASNPETIEVDVTPPGLSIITPFDPSLTADDDAFDAPGFQLATSFAVTDAAGYSIRLEYNCDSGACADSVLVQAASVAGGSSVIGATVDLPLVVSSAYRLLVEANDALGNSSTASLDLDLTLGDCFVFFTSLPTGGVLNADSCPAPGCGAIPTAISAELSADCVNAASARISVDGEDSESVAATGGDSADFTITLASGGSTVIAVEAVDSAGTTLASTGPFSILVDTQPPSVDFVASTVLGFDTPATGQNAQWGADEDLSAATDGLQFALRITADDSQSGLGQLTGLEFVGFEGTVEVEGASLPLDLATWPANLDLGPLTLPAVAEGTVVATVIDAAGNAATANFDVSIDISPPGGVALEAIAPEAVDPRLPAVTLAWAAPDDSGSAAVSYELRYSRQPITNAGEFDSACDAMMVQGTAPLPAPAAPGTAQSYTLSGPDPRPASEPCKFAPELAGLGMEPGPWYFAVRAKDAAGNRGPVEAALETSTDALRLRARTVTPSLDVENPLAFSRFVFAVGDVNGDGLGDSAYGGRDGHGFCIVFGQDAGEGALTDTVLVATGGPDHQCFLDAGQTGLGSPVVALGDVNGDGIDDFAAGAGGTNAPDSAEELRVYLGGATTPLSNAPVLTVRGASNGILYGLQAAGGGNFDGDVDGTTGLPLGDLVVASRGTNRAFVVPGRASWPADIVDLSAPTDRALFGVTTIRVADADPSAQFGFRVAFVGDALDSLGSGFDDVAITQSKNSSQVYLVQGRPFTGVNEILLSELNDGSQPGDSDCVRLLQETGQGKSAFGADIDAADLDGDGMSEILVNHPTNDRLHVFRGDAIAGMEGVSLRVNADFSAEFGDSVSPGETGWIVSGAYDSVSVVGNFDGDSLIPGGTPDIAAGLFDLFLQSYGEVSVRLNAGLSADGTGLGQLPYEDLVLGQPIAGGGIESFGATLVGIGDATGDGRPDLIVGTTTDGYSILIY